MDRTKAHRNTDVAKAVRRMRDRLSQKAGNPVFDREMVKLHARAMINSAMAIPLLVILIAAAGLMGGMDIEVAIWALITVSCYAGLAILARRVDRSETAKIDVIRTTRLFLL
ncbi:MAG: sensor histidine kinase, partial [Brucellaceae bacterium]|nr:sensor histidine kinase [Brucellaceae bacterium]